MPSARRYLLALREVCSIRAHAVAAFRRRPGAQCPAHQGDHAVHHARPERVGRLLRPAASPCARSTATRGLQRRASRPADRRAAPRDVGDGPGARPVPDDEPLHHGRSPLSAPRDLVHLLGQAELEGQVAADGPEAPRSIPPSRSRTWCGRCTNSSTRIATAASISSSDHEAALILKLPGLASALGARSRALRRRVRAAPEVDDRERPDVRQRVLRQPGQHRPRRRLPPSLRVRDHRRVRRDRSAHAPTPARPPAAPTAAAP